MSGLFTHELYEVLTGSVVSFWNVCDLCRVTLYQFFLIGEVGCSEVIQGFFEIASDKVRRPREGSVLTLLLSTDVGKYERLV